MSNVLFHFLCCRLRSWPALSPSALVIPPSTLWPAWTPGLAAQSQLVRSLQAEHHLSTDASECPPRRPCLCGSGTNAKGGLFTIYSIRVKAIIEVLTDWHFAVATRQTGLCVFVVRLSLSRVGCSVSVRDFRSSWRSGEAFLAILCSLRPQLVDLSLAQTRSNQENLEEAFLLAERELHIPRLLEPQGEAH